MTRDPPRITESVAAAAPGIGLLCHLKLTLLRNRLRQLLDRSPLKLLLAILFIAVIWTSLFLLFDEAFRFMRRFEERATLATPYVFHIFFVAMTAMLTFSTAVLAYGSLFSRPEPSFLLAAPNAPRNIVAVMYVEALFFASWSLVLLGVPLMLSFGQVQGLPWHFYLTFVVAFLGFVPIPGALGLLTALGIALWLPRQARRVLFLAGAAVIVLVVLWWSRLWEASSHSSTAWLNAFLAELQYLKGALLPSTWVTKAIQSAVDDRPGDAVFYLTVTVSTALFFSWAAVTFTGRKLLPAFGRANTVLNKSRAYSGWASRWITGLLFFYVPGRMRLLILKDVRNFLRDPVQWSQLVILFGLLALYLAYLPRSRPDGFDLPWQALICFLNYGAVTLILSTFTSRFVFPMISMEGRQMWLLALWPLARHKVIWAKCLYSITITTLAAMGVTLLSIRALELPPALSLVQAGSTLATCVGLCGLAVGLGAKLPCYHELNPGRIAAGLGGTINLIASVVLVAGSIALFGMICYRMVGAGSLNRLGGVEWAFFAGSVALGLGTAWFSVRMGVRAFRRLEY